MMFTEKYPGLINRVLMQRRECPYNATLSPVFSADANEDFYADRLFSSESYDGSVSGKQFTTLIMPV